MVVAAVIGALTLAVVAFYGINRLFGRGMRARVAELEQLEAPPLDASLDVTRLPLTFFQRWSSYGDKVEHEVVGLSASEVDGRPLVTFQYGVIYSRGMASKANDTGYAVGVAEVPKAWGHVLIAPGGLAPKWRSYLGKPLRLGLGRFERSNTVFGDEAFARSLLTPAFTEWWATMHLDQTLEINGGVAAAWVNLPIKAADRPRYAGLFLIEAVERIEAGLDEIAS